MAQISDHAVLRAILRRDFPSFAWKVFRTLNPTVQYHENWHLRAICWHLEQVRLRRILRLIITLPPRSGKSTLASVAFPAFVHGYDPSCSIVCASYGQDLAAKLQNDYRLAMASPWYTATFPDTRISALKDAEGEILLTGRGGRVATSVGGALTGRGADIFLIDDPLKPIDAFSEAKRAAVNEWFGSTALSRLNQKLTGAIVIITQRLHVDDLVGFLLERDPTGWVHLNLPAVAPTDMRVQIGDNEFYHCSAGSVLHEAREPQHVLKSILREVGPYAYAAQWLQEPVPPAGNLFKRDWKQTFDQAPLRQAGDDVIQSWDTASKTGDQNDYSACATLLKKEGIYYLLNVYRAKLSFTELKAKAIVMRERYAPSVVLVEDASIGQALIAELKANGIDAVGVKATQDKQVRAEARTPTFHSGRIKLPQAASWLADFEAELYAFPHGRHDDQVDAVMQALAYQIPRLTIKSIRF